MANFQIDKYVLNKTHKINVYYLTIQFNRKLKILIVYSFEKNLGNRTPPPPLKNRKDLFLDLK